MVLTRNQKRNFDLIEEDPLKLEDDYGNIKIVKKRKSSSDSSVTTRSTSTEELSFVSATTTSLSQGSCPKSDDTEDVESDIEAPVTNGTTEKAPYNLKLKSGQIQEIIKESIKQLVRRYDDNEQEFMNPSQMGTQEHIPSEYDKFICYVDKVQSGDFFERVPIEDRKKKLKQMYTPDDIRQFNQELEEINKQYRETAPSIIDILKMNVHSSHKQKLLEKLHHFTNSEVLSTEYSSSLKFLLTNINKCNEPELFQLEQEIIKSAQSEELSEDYRRKILKSKMSFENKVIAYKRLEIMERYEDSDSSEYSKYKNWMDILLNVPFGNFIQTPNMTRPSAICEGVQDYMRSVRTTLDQRLSFLEKPKDQIINIVAQMIRNPDFAINAIGLWGCKGTGQTSIVKSIAEALNRPYRSISLGGESDTSLLTGHGFTYVGSSPGRLIDILIETKCMNPVILVDEIDKISQTHHGKEIIGTLIHLTDSTTNHKYNYDRYFSGLEFDLSKVLFVFTYNDPTKVDRILADRLFKIKVDNYTTSEKKEITNKHIITNILQQYTFAKHDITFTNEAIDYIISSSKNDEGMRDIKRKCEIIISRINTLTLINPSEDVVKLKYKSLYSYYNSFPVVVQKEHVDMLLSQSSESDLLDSGPPPGMYL